MPIAFAACFVAVSSLIPSAQSGAGPRVLIVTPVGVNAADVEAGLRSGAASVPGAVVADATAAASLVDDARSTGLDCPLDDGACWLRVAVLGGFDHIVMATADTVTQVSAAGSSSSPVIDGHWSSAVRRAFLLESAVRLTLAPASATANVDGAAFVNGIAEGVTPGAHTVSATAPGFTPASTSVNVPPGAIALVALELTPEQVAVASSLRPTLFWSGVGGIAAGVVGGAGVAGGGWLAGGCSFGDEETAASCDDLGLANAYSIAGIAVGSALGLAGVGSVIASYVVE